MSRRYLRDFNAAVASTATATEFYAKMLASYPDRVTRGALRQRDGKNPGAGRWVSCTPERSRPETVVPIPLEFLR